MEKISFLTRMDGKFEEIEIQTSTITEFGIICDRVYRKKGGFSKWFKKGFVISNGKRYICRHTLISDLKKHFKGKIDSTEKETFTEQKYNSKGYFLGDRKATDWHFKLKQDTNE